MATIRHTRPPLVVGRDYSPMGGIHAGDRLLASVRVVAMARVVHHVGSFDSL